MSLLEPFKYFFRYIISTMQYQYYAIILAALGFALAAVITYFWGWDPALLKSPWFWGVVTLLLAVGIVVGIRYGLPRLRESRFLRRESSESVIGGQESPEEFQAKFTKALQTLRGLPQLRGKDSPLYALPWYLLIGEEASGKTTALRSADLFSALLPPSSNGATQNCDWWIANTAVVLDTSGRYVTQADKARDRAEWYHLLRLLHQHRQQEPINGLLIAVPADLLVSQTEEKIRTDASRLRERCEEAVRELGCDFPLYLVITKCDQLEGFREFFAPLPQRVQNEVLGFVDDVAGNLQSTNHAMRDESGLQRFQAGVATIYQRLHRLRLTLLDSKLSETLRQPVFCFPEEFKVIEKPLLTLAKSLLSVDPRYHTLLFRGLFFTSAQQQGPLLSPLRRQLQVPESTVVREEGNAHYFLYDLFHTILPRDRGLTTLTVREKRRRGFARLFGVGTWLTLALLLTLVLGSGYRTDRRIVAAVDAKRCADSAPQAPPRPAFDEVDSCQHVIATLQKENEQRSWWSNLWFTRSFQLEADLRRRYVQNFQTQVLTPLNTAIDQAVRTTNDPFPLMLLVAQRVALGQQCVSSGSCPSPLPEDVQPDYPLMLNPYRDRQLSSQQIGKLKTGYSSYLAWQPESPGVLQVDIREDQQRLKRWLQTEKLSQDRLLQWVNRRSPPVTYEQYWERPQPIATLASPEIEAACTKTVWEQRLAALLQQLQDAAPDVSTELQKFRQQHIANCFSQWQRFLAGFSQGAERWRGADRQTLVLRILTDESPYQRVLKDAWENLSPWLPAAGTPESLPPWLEQLRTYITAEQKPTYLELLQKLHTQLTTSPFPEAAFKVLRDSLLEGKLPAEATNPIQRAWLVAGQLTQATGATPESSEGAMWRSLLQEPVEFVERDLQEQANLHLQQLWEEEVEAAVANLPPAERLDALHGPNGKIATFVKQHLDPFLQPTPLLPGQEKVALPQIIAQRLDDGKTFAPVLKGDTTYPVQVQVGRRPSIEGDSPLREEQTVLSIACSDKTYRVTNRYEQGPLVVTVPWSYQTCGDVSLTVYFYFADWVRQPSRVRDREKDSSPADRSTKRIQLTKRYPGRTGFLRFLRDFANGSHRFDINDFDPDPEAGAVLQDGVNFVNVHYTLSVPPALAKLTSALESNTPRDSSSAASPIT
ncbi:MAG: type VI secretion protein IcmF/TssM N-terminal domain-containing protein [Candidatus Binatia bacterium]